MTRTTLRRWLFLAGIVPALLVAAYFLKVALMLSHASDGRGSFADGEYGAAAGDFGANRSLNLFESWVAAFDEGVAQHAAGELDAAVAAYTAALDDVPVEEECTVRINLALAHEAIGDAAFEPEPPDPPDPPAAVEAWQAGVDTLAEGDCPTDAGRGEEQTADAAAVDQRLREKLEQQDADGSGEGKDPKDPKQEPDDKESESKERRLERRNEAGTTERRRQQESDGDLDLGGPTW